MVIVQLTGGLGNQLFQYACGRAIAYRNQKALKLDITKYSIDPLRDCRLYQFNIAASITSPDEVTHYKLAYPGSLSRLYKLQQYLLPYYRRRVLLERHYHFDADILKASGNVYLKGYWHSERYFVDIADLLRQELTIKAEPDSNNLAMIRIIQQTESVNLHVRRGDFVSSAATNKLHGVCSLSYYENAITEVTKTVKEPRFFVFSDDIAWVQHNLSLAYPVTYVTHNGAEKDYEDLRLMSHCKYHIMANSTFSWWGAWLSAYPQKIVVAPKQWTQNPAWNDKDLMPATWIRL